MKAFISTTSFAIQVCIVLAVVSAFSCQRNTGTEYLGKWINVKTSQDTMAITRNGEQFLCMTEGKKIGGTYKDGSIDFGVFKATYVNSSDTLVANYLVGTSYEYKRLK